MSLAIKFRRLDKMSIFCTICLSIITSVIIYNFTSYTYNRAVPLPPSKNNAKTEGEERESMLTLDNTICKTVESLFSFLIAWCK